MASGTGDEATESDERIPFQRASLCRFHRRHFLWVGFACKVASDAFLDLHGADAEVFACNNIQRLNFDSLLNVQLEVLVSRAEGGRFVVEALQVDT